MFKFFKNNLLFCFNDNISAAAIISYFHIRVLRLSHIAEVTLKRRLMETSSNGQGLEMPSKENVEV